LKGENVVISSDVKDKILREKAERIVRMLTVWQDGQRHRDNDKPAIERADGSKFWLRNGQLHRDNDKAKER
jgi:hypothetical protein